VRDPTQRAVGRVWRLFFTRTGQLTTVRLPRGAINRPTIPALRELTAKASSVQSENEIVWSGFLGG
jgi:hypothetical protein